MSSCKLSWLIVIQVDFLNFLNEINPVHVYQIFCSFHAYLPSHMWFFSLPFFLVESTQFIYNWSFVASISSFCLLGMFSALRLAVQAFKREEDSAKSLKRRRERLELVYTLFQLISHSSNRAAIFVALKSILPYVRINVVKMIQTELNLLVEVKVCGFLLLSLTGS